MRTDNHFASYLEGEIILAGRIEKVSSDSWYSSSIRVQYLRPSCTARFIIGSEKETEIVNALTTICMLIFNMLRIMKQFIFILLGI